MVLDKKIIENRAEKDFIEFLNGSKNNHKIAIVCIDMQLPFLKKILFRKKKKYVLIKYIKKLRDLAIKNNVVFFDVIFTKFVQEKHNQSIFSNKRGEVPNIVVVEKSERSALSSELFLKELNDRKIDSLFVVGIYRTRCVFDTIIDLVKMKKFNIWTSFMGTSNVNKEVKDSEAQFFQQKQDIWDIYSEKSGNLTQLEREILGNEEDFLTFKNEIKIYQKYGVKILDYFSKK